MASKVDYVGQYKIALQKNVENVRRDILTGDAAMELKLRNYSEKFNIPYNFLKHKILRDNVYANDFAKDPSKQTLHQTLAAEYISQIDGVEDFETLPAGGKDALYVIDGVLGHDNEVNRGKAKSIDFHWKYKGFDFYASHKYTKDEGGAQDNQYADLTLFLEHASKSTNVKNKYLAIGDGPYYQKKDTKNTNMSKTRIDFMNSIYKTNNSRAITTDDLEDFLKGL